MSEVVKYLIVLGVVTLVIVSWVYLVKDTLKRVRSRTFVYPNTGHEYYVEGVVKSKDMTTGEWYEAILYKGVTQPGTYVRNREDFLKKFIPIEDWKSEK